MVVQLVLHVALCSVGNAADFERLTETCMSCPAGGYIGLLMCERYFRENPEYAGNIEPRMRELQEAGVWTRIRRELFPRYHGEYDGIEFVLQLNDDKNKALQTLE